MNSFYKKISKLIVWSALLLGVLSNLLINNTTVTAVQKPKATFTTKVYLADTFKILTDFSDYYGFSYETAKAEIEQYDAYLSEELYENPNEYRFNTNQELADAYWSGKLLDYWVENVPPNVKTGDTWKKEYSGFSEDDSVEYYSSIGFVKEREITCVSKNGAKVKVTEVTIKDGKNKTVSEVRAAIQAYENGGPIDENGISPTDSNGNPTSIVVAVFVNSQSNKLTGATAIVKYSDLLDESKGIEYIDAEAYYAKIGGCPDDDGNTKTFTTDMIYAQNYTVPGYAQLGWTTPANSPYIANEDFFVGGFKGQLKTTVNGNISVGLAIENTSLQSNNLYNYIDDGGINRPINYSTATEQFINEPFNLLVNGASPNPSLKNLTVSGVSLSVKEGTAETTTIDGINYVTKGEYVYTGSEPNPLTNAVGDISISPTVEGGGFTTITYTDPNNGAEIPVSNNSGVYTILMSSFKPGQSVKVKINTTSSDGNNNGEYYVTLTNKKSSDASLDSLTISSCDGTTTSVVPKITTTSDSSAITSGFVNGGNYYVYIPKDARSVKLTPEYKDKLYTYDGAENQKLYFNGSNTVTPSGEEVALPSVSDGSKFTIVVKAQDGVTTATYNFTVKHMDTDSDLTNLNVKGNSSNTIASFTKDTNGVYTSTTALKYADTSFTLLANWNKNQQKVEIIQFEGVNKNVVLTKNTYTSESFNFNNQTTLQTVVVKIRITYEAGNSKEFEVKVVRDAASKDTSLSALNLKGDGFTTAGIVSSLVNKGAEGADNKVCSEDTFFYLVSPSVVGFTGTNCKLAPVLKDGGTINSVKYGASLNSMTQSANKTGNDWVITESFVSTIAKGTCFYAEIKVTALDGVTTKTYHVVIQKQMDTNRKLNTVGFDVQGSQAFNGYVVLNGSTIVRPYNATSNYTLNSATAYQVLFANDINSLKLKLTYTGECVEINGVKYATVASSNYTALPADGIPITSFSNDSSIDVKVYSQDGKSTTYSFTVKLLSTDTSLNSNNEFSIVDNKGNEYFESFDNSSNKITIDSSKLINGKLPFSVSSLTITANKVDSNATVKYTIGRVIPQASTISGQNMSFTVTTETKMKFIVEIQPQCGSYFGNMTRKVELEITREAANDDYSFTFDGDIYTDNVQEKNNSNLIEFVNFDDSTRPTKVSIAPIENGTPFEMDYQTKTIKFTIKPNNTNSKIEINGIDYTNKEYTWNLSRNVNAKTHSLSIKVITQAGTHTVTLSAKTAQADNNADFKTVIQPDNSNKSYPVLKNTNTNTPEAGTVVLGTPANNSVSNKISYELLQDNYTNSPTFKIQASAVSAKAKIYKSTDYSNLKQSEFDENNDVFNVGTTYYITVFSEYGNYTTWQIVTDWKDTRSDNANFNKITISNPVEGGTPISFTFSKSTLVYDGTEGNGAIVVVPFTVDKICFGYVPEESHAVLNDATRNNEGIQLLSNPGDYTFKFKLKAQNETETGPEYTIVVRRQAGQTGDDVTSLKINGINVTLKNDASKPYIYEAFNPANHKNNVFDVVLPKGSTSTNISFEVSLNAKFNMYYENDNFNASSTMVSGNSSSIEGSYTINGLKNSSDYTWGNPYTEVTIQVLSEKDSVSTSPVYKNYKIRIYTASQDSDFSGMDLLYADSNGSIVIDGNRYSILTDVNGNVLEFNPGDTSYNGVFEIAYKAGAPFFNVTANDDPFAKVTVNGSESSPITINANSTKTITIKVESEYQKYNSGKATLINQAQTYTIKIKRKAADTVNTLDSLTVSFGQSFTGTLNPEFDKDKLNYKIENIPDSVKNCEVTFEKTSKLADVTGDIGTVEILTSEGVQVLTIKVTAENGSIKEYKITLSRTVYVPDSDNSLTNVLISSSGTNYCTPAFSASVITYPNIKLPATLSGFDFIVTKSSSKATTEITAIDVDTNQQLDISSGSLDNWYIQIDNGQKIKITLVCIAEDNSKSVPYEFTIFRPELDKDATASTIKINDVNINNYLKNETFDPAKDTYTIYLQNGTESVYLDLVPNKITSTITSNSAPKGSPKSLEIGTNTINATITSQDSSVTKTYVINVVRLASDILDSLNAFTNPDDQASDLISFDGSKNYQKNVDYTVKNVYLNAKTKAEDNVTIKVEVLAPGASKYTSAQLGENSLAVGKNKFKISVVQVNGEANEYIVEITREAGSKDAFITAYETENGDALQITSTQFTYSYALSRGTVEYMPDWTDELTTKISISPNATATLISDKILKPGEVNTKIIEVTSQDGSVVNRYTFNVIPANTDFEITSIKAYTDSTMSKELESLTDNSKLVFNPKTESYELSVPFSTSTFYLVIKTNDSFAEVRVDANGVMNNSFTSGLLSINPKTNSFKILSISEYGKLNPHAKDQTSAVYELKIIRAEENKDTSLKSLKVTIDGKEYVATQSDLDSKKFIIQGIEGATSIRIDAAANNPATNIMGLGSFVLGTDITLNPDDIVIDESGTIFSFPIVCQSKDNSKYSTTYTVTVSRGPVDLNSDNTIVGLTVVTVVNGTKNTYIGNEEFDGSVGEYNITIPFGPKSYTITVLRPTGTKSTLVGIDNSGTEVYTIDNECYKNGRTHTIYAISQTNEQGKEYRINITFIAPSDDATLKDLRVDGTTVSGFNPNVFVYTVSTRANSVTNALIEAIVNNEFATVTGVGNVVLEVGPNAFNVLVTAQDSSIKIYTINISRDYPTPYLTDLNVPGSQLLDDKFKNTTFNKDVFNYSIILPYKGEGISSTATIAVTVDNANYILTCTNALANITTGLTRTFGVPNVVEGNSTYTIRVTSNYDRTKYSEYTLTIRLRGKDSINTNLASPSIDQIEDFANDFSNKSNDLVYGSYKVPNSVDKLTMNIVPEKIADSYGDGATVEILGGDNLSVGVNQVVIVVTAEDGVTKKAIVIKVERLAMEFEIDKNATDLKCEEVGDLKYNIEMAGTKPSDINFKDYIKFDQEKNNITVDVLSDVDDDKLNEVIVKVSDGSNSKYVTFKLDNSLKYEVDKNATDYLCTKETDTVYRIDMKGQKASAITNYSKYITGLSKNATVEVLSDTENASCNEVLLRVSNGNETEIVTLKLDNVSTFSVQYWWIWIVLAVGLITLFAILVSVNRDKYGRINKKRKQA